MPKGQRSKSFCPPKDSLAWRLLAYLHANRDEELTRSDIATKFDVEAASVDTMLEPAERAGLLLRTVSNDSGVVWRLRRRGAFPMPFTGSLAAANKALRRRSAVVIDFTRLEVEKGLAIPEPMRTRNGGQWRALFEQMDVGDSVRFERRAKAAVAHAQASYRKGRPAVRFAIRQIDEGHVRIWRTA